KEAEARFLDRIAVHVPDITGLPHRAQLSQMDEPIDRRIGPKHDSDHTFVHWASSVLSAKYVPATSVHQRGTHA
ncbi:MAG TPA: hypothetical protein VM512_01150, partial [Burkholderiaceae bacterium]|nr:hypothetical protein [Burkholderiaceae bacterium]